MTASATVAPIHPSRDRAGRVVLGLLTLSTIGAFAQGLFNLAAAGPDRVFVEGWRTFGFLVFAGLFALLTVRPRASPLIWELVFVQKVAVTIIGYANVAAFESIPSAHVDLGLVIGIVVAWILCQGWLSWSRAAAPVDPAARALATSGSGRQPDA